MQSSVLRYNLQELQDILISLSYPRHKAGSIFKWIYKKSIFDFEQMTDLSKSERQNLREQFSIPVLQTIFINESQDGTLKFLFKAQDEAQIESVMIPNEGDSRYTICVSSQVGCALRCSFCATGQLGFSRHLLREEIISQVLLVDAEIKKRYKLDPYSRALDNIVFMGMGEPMLNYEEVLKSIEILNNQAGFDIGTRRITISTAGIINGIEKFIQAPGQIRLALSLHAANHEKRKNIMPIARKENTRQVLDIIRLYQKETGRRITIEYILIEGFNDSEKDVLALKHELTNIKYNLNVIPLNPVDNLPYDAPSYKGIQEFTKKLKHHSIPFVLRTPKGQDINAACGQLALKNTSMRQS